ncbi:hypothetical protein A0H81_06513 [Grifola frondosa]|uniref:F-box domain-containing protein n=1 Tax=Grifola frondosa TaxID=5627 RepID=A0A1C7MC76_GRIFR|nr:hypothetical protein A0H81_06513 [Grifola frondosa]
MPLLFLNEDILHLVVVYLPIRDALRFCAVSRTMYKLAMPDALSSVVLSTDTKKTRQFCVFMLENEERPLWLRGLYVSYNAIEPKNDTEILMHLLERSRLLRRLHIERFEDFLSSYPGALEACAGLQHLVVLSLLQCGSLTLQLLSRVSETCRDIWKLAIHPNCIGTVPFDHIFVAVAKFQHLQTLQLWNFGGMILPPSLHTKLRVPSLRSLDVAAGTLPITLAVQMFPNLRNLKCWMVFSNFEDRLSARQMTNDKCWKHLHHVETDFGMSGGTEAGNLWPLRLSCTVHRLDLGNMYNGMPNAIASQIESALVAVRQTSPRILTIATSTDNLEFWARLPTSAPQLRYLEFVVTFHERCSSNLVAWQDNVITPLSKLPILVMFFSIRFASPRTNSHHCPTDAQAAIATIVQSLASSSPSLQYVGASDYEWMINGCSAFVRPSIRERKAARWWRIANIGDSEPRNAERISTELGDRVRAYLCDADYDTSISDAYQANSEAGRIIRKGRSWPLSVANILSTSKNTSPGAIFFSR